MSFKLRKRDEKQKGSQRRQGKMLWKLVDPRRKRKRSSTPHTEESWKKWQRKASMLVRKLKRRIRASNASKSLVMERKSHSAINRNANDPRVSAKRIENLAARREAETRRKKRANEKVERTIVTKRRPAADHPSRKVARETMTSAESGGEMKRAKERATPKRETRQIATRANMEESNALVRPLEREKNKSKSTRAKSLNQRLL
jgi:hypothetical protein